MQLVEGRVLETRRRDRLVYRRRVLASGETYWTVELPETAFVQAVYKKRLATALDNIVRGRARRQKAAERLRLVQENLDVKGTALALMLGCSEARARQIRATIKR